MSRVKAEVLEGTVEKVVNPMLEVICGYTSEECIAEIKNEDMRKAIVAYGKAVSKERSGQWDRAKAVSRMRIECREEFGDDGRLASFLGLKSASEFSKLYRAGILAKEAEKAGINELPPLSVVTEMIVLDGKKYGEQNLLECLRTVIDKDLTVAETREYVKGFKTEKPEQKPTEEPEQKPTEEPEQKPTEEPDQKPTEEPEQKPTEEDRWIRVIAVEEKALGKLDKKTRNAMLRAMSEVCISYGLDETDLWIFATEKE